MLLLAYTSGTTGKPKGAVHTHAGFLVKVASEVAYGFEMAPGRTFCWITDMGWIMGPLSIVRHPRLRRHPAALRRLTGRPGHQPALAASSSATACTMLGVSPTLVRDVAGRRRRSPAE